MRHIFTLSGGKDSQATVIWALENLREEFEVIFCDTGWESDDTYRFLLEFEAQLQKPVNHLKSKLYNGVIDLAQKRHRFPSLKARFCTEELKIKPMIDYILDEVRDDVIVYQGIRHEESRNRAGMNRSDDYFKGYIEPYKTTFNERELVETRQELLQIETIAPHDTQRRAALEKRIKTLESKLRRGILQEPSYYSYRRKEVLAYCERYEARVYRPILTWTTEEVFAYITSHGFRYNPLYDKGAKRVGCYPCVLCSLSEVAHIAQQDPERIAAIREAEKQVGWTFFATGFIPEAYCTFEVQTKDGLKKLPTIDDVIRYSQTKNIDGVQGAVCQNPFTPCE